MDKIKPSFFEKEIRCDFLVDEKRKSVGRGAGDAGKV